jgi:hypothetical protein
MVENTPHDGASERSLGLFKTPTAAVSAVFDAAVNERGAG